MEKSLRILSYKKVKSICRKVLAMFAQWLSRRRLSNAVTSVTALNHVDQCINSSSQPSLDASIAGTMDLAQASQFA